MDELCKKNEQLENEKCLLKIENEILVEKNLDHMLGNAELMTEKSDLQFENQELQSEMSQLKTANSKLKKNLKVKISSMCKYCQF